MMKAIKHKKLIVFVVVVAGIWAWWTVNYPSGSWRYKITVAVETPEGVKTGSAVHELSMGTPLIDLPDVGNPATIIGEAVVVDLGARGVLFALVSNQYVLYQAFPVEAPSSKRGLAYYRKTLKPGMKAELSLKNYPQMVMFGNLNDPKSVKLVRGVRFNVATQKEDSVDDLEALFGAGVRLKGVTVEITDEPVTWGIEKWLPWLPGLNGHYLHGRSTGRDAPLGLHAGYFQTGRK